MALTRKNQRCLQGHSPFHTPEHRESHQRQDHHAQPGHHQPLVGRGDLQSVVQRFLPCTSLQRPFAEYPVNEQS